MWKLTIFILFVNGDLVQKQEFDVYTSYQSCLDAADRVMRYFDRPHLTVEVRCDPTHDDVEILP